NWTAAHAYALKDANAGNVRSSDAWLGFSRAKNVNDIRSAMRGLGMPWVNTIAADRDGNAMYADASVVPDVDAAQLARCAPGKPAAALLGAAGLVVLNGSRADCDWRRDPASPVPGLTPIDRMAVAVRGDWVQNSNDSFFYTHPGQTWPAISPLVGDDVMRRPRTREGLFEIRDLVGRGPVTLDRIQRTLFLDRNLMGRVTVPDLLAACPAAPTPETKEACAVLARWNWTSDLNAKGAVLFREFWRTASTIPNVYREPFDKARPEATPTGLNMASAEVAGKVWDALGGAVGKIRDAGFKPDATLAQVQRPAFTDEPVPLHGGDEIEGVLNNLGDRAKPGITKRGIRIDYGTSYVQTVSFDERGPVAQAILTYGQSTDPGSPHQTDQLWLFTSKRWPRLPFHPADIAGQQLGDAVVLVRP
ncbi:MAG: penicillin acylase family protein, partial [Ottowia sp.]|nr:penicillin acylase family protein [Ottowia sp.]